MPDAVKSGINVEVKGADDAAKEIKEYADSVEKLADSTEDATKEINAMDEALQQLADQKAAEQRMEDLVTAGSKVVENAAVMAERVIKAGEAFVSAASDAAEYADAIGKAAQNVGFSNEAYQEWDYVLQQNGSSMKAAAGSIVKLEKAQHGLTKTAGEDFRRIGLTLEEVQNLSPEELFAAVIEKLQEIPDVSDRTVAATALLGQGFAKNLGPVLDLTAEETAALREQIHELGGVLSDEQIANSGAFNDAVDNLQIRFNSLKQEVLLGALPAMTKFAETLTSDESVEKISDVVGTLTEKVADFAGFLAEHSEGIITTVEAVGVAFGTWKAAGLIKTLVGDMQDLIGLIDKAGALLGVSGGTLAGSVGVIALSVGTILDEVKTLNTVGYLGDGHELQDYADNVQSYADAIAAWHEQNDAYLASGYTEGLEMLQIELSHLEVGLQHAQEEYAHMQEAQAQASEASASAAAEASDAADAAAQVAQEASAATAESAADIADAWTASMDLIEETAGETREIAAAELGELGAETAAALQETNDVMAESMGVLSANAGIWAEDMMISFANGIRTGANKWVFPAITEMAEMIAANLQHSEPDKGPLSDDSTWMPDMMQSFAQGIRDNKSLLESAIVDSFDLRPVLDAGMGGGRTFNYGGVTVVINAAEGQSAEELYEEFSYRLQHDVIDREAVYST